MGPRSVSSTTRVTPPIPRSQTTVLEVGGTGRMAPTTTRHSDGQMVYLGSRGNRPDHHTQRLPQTGSGLEHLLPGHRGRPGARAGATVDAALDGHLEISVPRPPGCARVHQASSVADSPVDAAS